MSRLSSNFLSCRCISYHQVLIHVSLPVILQVLTNVSLPAIIHVPTLLVYRFTNTFLSCQLTGYHTSSYSCQFTGYTGSYSYQFTGYHLRFYTWQWTCYIQVLTNVNVPATQQLLTHAGVCRSITMQVLTRICVSATTDSITQVLTRICVPATIDSV